MLLLTLHPLELSTAGVVYRSWKAAYRIAGKFARVNIWQIAKSNVAGKKSLANG